MPMATKLRNTPYTRPEIRRKRFAQRISAQKAKNVAFGYLLLVLFGAWYGVVLFLAATG